ncbi:MAG: ornithine carbamoyltransferase [Candidatus Omnitrophica bacterium]|nr:ornithine carbamoyltransferase [Candidatus Omnitrophota bacterium]
MKKDLVSIKDLSSGEIKEIFSLTTKLKENKVRFRKALAGKTLALVFQKPSNRTRVSFEVGMYQLGGNSIYLAPHEINLGVRESVKDVAKTLSRYVEGIVVRTFSHGIVVDMARYADVPVINGLSDFSHPCQALADIFTVQEKIRNRKNIVFSYVGDGNNVCNSLIFTCAKLGIPIHLGIPKGYGPQRDVLLEAAQTAGAKAGSIQLFSSAARAVKSADVIYTDVWASMGQEKESRTRKLKFKDFQVNRQLLLYAKKDVLVMHCLPAHRGEEITDEVMESRHSIVFDQAENRMHVQKAILIKLLGGEDK